MTSSPDGATFGIWIAVCSGLFVLQAYRASRFLHTFKGPPLSVFQLAPVALVYLICTGWLLTYPDSLSATTVWRSVGLLVFAVPMILTDLRCQWLPMRYTVAFWSGGLLSSALPGAVLTWPEALKASVTAFCLSAAVRWVANYRHRKERMGLGDVYLMAGLCAWMPWRSACYAASGGLILCCVCAILTRETSKPFAPALFGYLSGVCLFFPQLLAGVL